MFINDDSNYFHFEKIKFCTFSISNISEKNIWKFVIIKLPQSLNVIYEFSN